MTSTMRASDSDRQLAADLLAEHHAAGRLSLSEYDERLAKAYRAVYRDDFRPLFADLPGGSPRFVAEGPADQRAGSGSSGGARPFDSSWFTDGARYAADSLRQTAHRRPAGRMHPALWALAVVGGLLLIGALVHIVVHLVLPVLVIGAIVYFVSRHRRCGVRRDFGARSPR